MEKFKKANKYIKEDTIWSYVIQICRALNEMHSRSILHRVRRRTRSHASLPPPPRRGRAASRLIPSPPLPHSCLLACLPAALRPAAPQDIKPKNVFLTGKNHVRLGDLGCAKLMKTGLARTQIGTPYYMSPEIWQSKPYDCKSDMWALGCLVYELAMLAPPFVASDMTGLAAKVKGSPAARISKHYGEELANLVAALLSEWRRGALAARSRARRASPPLPPLPPPPPLATYARRQGAARAA